MIILCVLSKRSVDEHLFFHCCSQCDEACSVGNRLGTCKKWGITCSPWSLAKWGGSWGSSSSSCSTQQRLKLSQAADALQALLLVLLWLVVLLFLPAHPNSTPSWHILNPCAEKLSVCITKYSISGKLVCHWVLLWYFITTNNSLHLSSTYFFVYVQSEGLSLNLRKWASAC